MMAFTLRSNVEVQWRGVGGAPRSWVSCSPFGCLYIFAQRIAFSFGCGRFLLRRSFGGLDGARGSEGGVIIFLTKQRGVIAW